MFLLETGAFRKELGAALYCADQEVIVLSAFIKLDALRWLIGTSKTDNLKVVSRWKPNDLISGASDLDCFHLCDEVDIPFGISQNLHGKVYIADSKIFIGSANLTSKGMSLSQYDNDEFGTGFEYGETEKTKIQDYLATVNWLDAHTVELMADHLQKIHHDESVQDQDWPEEISRKLASQPISVWFHDLPMCTTEELLTQSADVSALEHDLACFQCDIGASEAELLRGFISSPISLWLKSQLQESDELSFGEVTSLFHSQVLDDPVPYRQAIKAGLANLFEWATKCDTVFEVRRPRHRQVIRTI